LVQQCLHSASAMIWLSLNSILLLVAYGRTALSGGIAAIGIGNFTSANLPLSALHVNTNLLPGPPNLGGEVFRTDCPVLAATAVTAWRMFRGGLEFGTLFSTAPGTAFQLAAPRGNMQLRTLTFGTPGFSTQRMLLSSDGINRPRVSISNAVFTPKSYLHLGNDALAGGGFRSWMNVGVLMVSDSTGVAQDNMYVGLRQIAPDRVDAIINWGNNPTPQGTVVDRLRFVFTAATGLVTLDASGPDGIEVARL